MPACLRAKQAQSLKIYPENLGTQYPIACSALHINGLGHSTHKPYQQRTLRTEVIDRCIGLICLGIAALNLPLATILLRFARREAEEVLADRRERQLGNARPATNKHASGSLILVITPPLRHCPAIGQNSMAALPPLVFPKGNLITAHAVLRH
jgi:hypothetical protein